MHADEPLRGYAVTLVARTMNEYHLQPLVELPEGSRRPSTVYQAEGPIPPLDVAEGEITEYGVRGRRLGSVCRRAGCWPGERY